MQVQHERREPLIPEARMGRILDSARRTIHELASTVSELDRELAGFHADAMPAQLDRQGSQAVEVFRGAADVRVLLQDATAMVTNRILSMYPGTPLPAPLLAADQRRGEEALGRGVAIRTIHSESMLRVPRGRAHLNALRTAGAEIRTAPTLPYRLLVLDSSLALVPALGNDEGTEPAVGVVRSPDLVRLFEQLFEFCWQGARPAESATTSRPGQPTRRQYEVLRLMRLGYKDEAIAREIGVSSRTMRRIVAALYEQLDASSRFSAGMAVQSRGWLSRPPD
ncbi:response regulator transcription factor [Kitasatospora sp. NPDC087314]|uniref:helix-turn-helix transcriptional regulator n=1 Tax=Kitasatospora sp. NPDC087314 TaxID=3364068 RepID=UPI0038099E9F